MVHSKTPYEVRSTNGVLKAGSEAVLQTLLTQQLNESQPGVPRRVGSLAEQFEGYTVVEVDLSHLARY